MDAQEKSPCPGDLDTTRVPKKRYQPPKVVYEGKLETSAGSLPGSNIISPIPGPFPPGFPSNTMYPED